MAKEKLFTTTLKEDENGKNHERGKISNRRNFR